MAAPLILGEMALGTGLQAAGAYRRGKLARLYGRLQSQQYKASAKQAVASSQRAAFEEQRRAELMASRALAVAAAGGGGADDPTVTKIIADINGEGAYRAAVAMYEGEEAAKKLRFEAAQAEYLGEQEYKASKMSVVDTVLRGGGSLYAGLSK